MVVIELSMYFIETSRFTIILSFVSGTMCRREVFSLCAYYRKRMYFLLEFALEESGNKFHQSIGIRNVGTRVRPSRLKSQP